MAWSYVQRIVPAVLLIFISCQKKDSLPSVPEEDASLIYVLNEGSLGNGNASVSAIDKTNGRVYENIYTQANGMGPGDIVEDLVFDGHNWVMSVSNSDRLDIINPQDWKVKHSITLSKPRTLYRLRDGRILVGTLFSNRFYVLQTNDYSLQEYFLPYKNPESFLENGSDLLVACWDDDCRYIYVLDATSLQLTDSIKLANFAPHRIEQDADQFIWVLGGNAPNYKTPFLQVMASDDYSSKRVLSFPSGANPIHLRKNAQGTSFYFVGVDYQSNSYNGIFKIEYKDSIIPLQPIIPAANHQYFWALGIDPLTEHIYYSDPKGFVQKGEVHLADKDGQPIRSYSVGVGPKRFIFAH